MNSKKGVVGVQFNWIFVLFVGGVLVGLVAFIVLKQRDAAELSRNAALLKSVTSIITSATVNLGTSAPVSIGDADIEFSCNRIGIGDVSQSYDGLILFGPDVVSGSKMITHTVSFDIPYRIANLLYVTSDDYRYVFVGSNSHPLKNFIDGVRDSFSDRIELNQIVDRFSDISDERNYRTRVISFDDGATSFTAANRESVSNSFEDKESVTFAYVKLTGDFPSNIEGNVVYYSGSTSLETGRVYFYNMETLLGALFMDSGSVSSDEYNCVMKNAHRRVNHVSKVLRDRADALTSSDYPEVCTTNYEEARSLFSSILDKTIPEDLLNDDPDTAAFRETINGMDSLESHNNIFQRRSCPLIY